MSESLLERLILAGTPAALVAEVAMTLARAEAAAEPQRVNPTQSPAARRQAAYRARLITHGEESVTSDVSDGQGITSDATTVTGDGQGITPITRDAINITPPTPLEAPPVTRAPTQTQPPLILVESSQKTPPLGGSKRVSPKPRPTRISEDWAPSDRNRADAHRLGVGDIDGEADQFRDHHLKNATLFADWDAAWRTWSRNSVKWRARAGPVNGHRHPSRDSILADIQRKAHQEILDGERAYDPDPTFDLARPPDAGGGR